MASTAAIPAIHRPRIRPGNLLRGWSHARRFKASRGTPSVQVL